jgi:ribose 5-phosphate isomerase A
LDRWKLKPEPEPVSQAKRNAALEAVKHVKDGFTIGLGSGSTAAYAIEAIAEKTKLENLNVKGIPTSTQAFSLAVKHGIPVTTLEEHGAIDLCIDGADQIDPNLNLIKGMGAALTREKIVASASKQNIIIADESKRVKVLGEMAHPVPEEKDRSFWRKTCRKGRQRQAWGRHYRQRQHDIGRGFWRNPRPNSAGCEAEDDSWCGGNRVVRWVD